VKNSARKKQSPAVHSASQSGDDVPPISQSIPSPSTPSSDAAVAIPSQGVKPKGWNRVEIAATFISCLALLVSLWSLWLQRDALLASHKLVLKAEIKDSEDFGWKSCEMVLSPVDSSHQIQSVRLTSPKYGYDENLVRTATSSRFLVDYELVLSRAAACVERRCPKTSPPDRWWTCKDSLPLVMEAEYIAGGKLRLHRGLYVIHFVDLVVSKDRPTEPLEMSFISYERELNAQEKANEVADAELTKRQFIWQ
jgi:hypothetical protein